MSVIPDALYHLGGVPVGGIQSWDVGNVYFVIDSDHPRYNEFLKQRQTGSYANDGTSMVHSTIATALTATVTERNDYVVIVPHSHTSAYYLDQTATLTMNKNHVHLISPENFGTRGMGYKSPMINTTGSVASVTLTGHNCELGGLFFRGKQTKDIIDVGEGTNGLHVHDCFFGMSATDGNTNKGIDASVMYYFNIHDNYFTNWNPGAVHTTTNDIGAFISISSGAATRGYILNNTFSTGCYTVVAAGILSKAHDALISGNVFWETPTAGAALAGTFTVGIDVTQGEVGLISDNRFGITDTSKAIVGGTAINCINNYSCADGGTIVS